MTWRSFVDFWIMREMGHEDAVMRNYDILRYHGKRGGRTHLWLAIRRLGEPVVAEDDAVNMLPELAQRLVNIGASRPRIDQLELRLAAWYTWDRIRKGEIQQWFLSPMVKQNRSKQ